jgi:hypothetical protein
MKRLSLTHVVYGLLAACVVFIAAAAAGVFDSPEQRVQSATRKCRSALSINMLRDAAEYCADAAAGARDTRKVSDLAAAGANMQMAAFVLTQKRVGEAAEYCRLAIANWSRVKSGFMDSVRARDIAACESVIELSQRPGS